MPSRDDYRCKAEACVAHAEILRDPQERAVFLAIAQLYMKLSERGTTRRCDSDQLIDNDG